MDESCSVPTGRTDPATGVARNGGALTLTITIQNFASCAPLAGSVILYLHWFDKEFQRIGGPPQWAGPSWCVTPPILRCWRALYQGRRLTGWIEKLEGWLGLEIDREKTGVVKLKEDWA